MAPTQPRLLSTAWETTPTRKAPPTRAANTRISVTLSTRRKLETPFGVSSASLINSLTGF